MIPKNLLYVIILISVIVFTYWLINSSTNTYEDYLYGMWVGSEAYCDESNIDNMMLFVGKPDKKKGILSTTTSRKGYLIIGPNVCNSTINIEYKGVANKTINAKVIFDDEEEPPFPEDVIINLDIVKGCMKIYNNDTLYGHFYKNHEITEYSDE